MDSFLIVLVLGVGVGLCAVAERKQRRRSAERNRTRSILDPRVQSEAQMVRLLEAAGVPSARARALAADAQRRGSRTRPDSAPAPRPDGQVQPGRIA